MLRPPNFSPIFAVKFIHMAKINHKYPLKITLAALLIVLAVVFGVYGAGIYQIYHFNSKMEIPDGPDNLILTIHPDSAGFVHDAVDCAVTIDMGSRHSFITAETLARLKGLGYDAQEQQTLLYTTDQSGHYRIYTRKVVMPVKFLTDSVGTDTVTFNHVELLISNREEGNLLGMDFLEKFVLAHDKHTGAISLLRAVPDSAAFVTDLNGHDSAIGDLFGYSRRVYVSLMVNDETPENYYLDTGRGMRSCALVQPKKNISKATTPVRRDSISGMMIQDNCRVQIGDRMRFAQVTYSDSLHTDEYSINPFTALNRSVILDLPQKKLYYAH